MAGEVVDDREIRGGNEVVPAFDRLAGELFDRLEHSETRPRVAVRTHWRIAPAVAVMKHKPGKCLAALREGAESHEAHVVVGDAGFQRALPRAAHELGRPGVAQRCVHELEHAGHRLVARVTHEGAAVEVVAGHAERAGGLLEFRHPSRHPLGAVRVEVRHEGHILHAIRLVHLTQGGDVFRHRPSLEFAPVGIPREVVAHLVGDMARRLHILDGCVFFRIRESGGVAVFFGEELMVEPAATDIHRVVVAGEHAVLDDVAHLVVEVHHRDEAAVGFQAGLDDFVHLVDPLAAPGEILGMQVGRLGTLAFADPVALRRAVLIIPDHHRGIAHDEPLGIRTVDHFIAAKRAAAEVEFESHLLHQIEEMVEVEIRIRPALEIELACGMFSARRAHQMGGPLDIGGDILESGVLEFLKDRLPVAFLQSEVLDFAAEDIF